jgi:hypothetical protein
MTKVRTTTKNNAELRAASEHLHYEIDHVEHLVTEISGAQPGFQRNADIESFLVHARLVAHFLGWNRKWTDSNKGAREDDILAEDFVSSWSPSVPPMVINQSVNEEIGKRVAHLTYKRQHATVDKHEWRFSEIAGALVHEVLRFVQSVAPNKLSQLHWARWIASHQSGSSGPSGPPYTIPSGVVGATGPAGD